MTKTTTNLLLMLITILAGTYFYITCCSECSGNSEEELPQETVISAAPEASSYPFSFQDGNYSYEDNDNYNFNVSSSTILMPLAQDMQIGISSLKDFLAENSNKVFNITGYYTSEEDNTSAFPNLGLARANSVKNHLVSQGIRSAQLNTMGKLIDDMVPKDNIYLGPVAYNLENKSDTEEDDIKALYDKIKENPLVLYFDTAETSINLSATQRQKVADISKYLDKVEGTTANIIGHTDNTGSAATNMELGLERANFAKAYLMRNGIAETKIAVSSKGQTSPIADNATEEGKAKNRRTIVTLN